MDAHGCMWVHMDAYVCIQIHTMASGHMHIPLGNRMRAFQDPFESHLGDQGGGSPDVENEDRGFQAIMKLSTNRQQAIGNRQ